MLTKEMLPPGTKVKIHRTPMPKSGNADDVIFYDPPLQGNIIEDQSMGCISGDGWAFVEIDTGVIFTQIACLSLR